MSEPVNSYVLFFPWKIEVSNWTSTKAFDPSKKVTSTCLGKDVRKSSAFLIVKSSSLDTSPIILISDGYVFDTLHIFITATFLKYLINRLK